ncbi:MAG TPA: hypothetical protein VF049_05095 [Nocardioidaceae bacterium]
MSERVHRSDGRYNRAATDDELTDPQLAAMDALWRARRAGVVDEHQAARIEDVIRHGHVHGARKRLTDARRARRADPGPPPSGGA